MFDVAPTEFLLVVVVALVVIGPKDLPKAMRFVGKWVGKARGMARHFRSGLDTMMREAELEELEKQWRKQNDEIMRQFPSNDAPSEAKSTSAPTENVVTENPDFEAAIKPASPDGAHGDEIKPESHIVPPRGSELP